MSWHQQNSPSENASSEQLRKYRHEYSKLHQTSSPSSSASSLISRLHLQPHIEGGYFVETDRDTRRIANPFLSLAQHSSNTNDEAATRAASTSIFYLLTPDQSVGHFHRNKGRTVHTLHWGRGRYVLIHGDEVEGEWSAERIDKMKDGRKMGSARVESFVVGKNVEEGEVVQWIVEGGKWKSSFLLPDGEEGKAGSEGLLISETVVPGFEYSDHDFLTEQKLKELVSPEQAEQLTWLLRKE